MRYDRNLERCIYVGRSEEVPSPIPESKLDRIEGKPKLGPSGGTGIVSLARPVILSVQQMTLEDRRVSIWKHLNSLAKGDE